MKNALLFCTLILLIGCGQTFPKKKGLIKCQNPRPQMCIKLFAPVCDPKENKTYSNWCTACSHPKVNYYKKGACKQIPKILY